MECTEARELLSEYIDGALEKDGRVILEDHLSSCRACSEELASLISVVQEIRWLDPVPAPGGFLEKLQEKIEAPPRLSRVLHTLFMPLRIKIPLEFAGLAAAALLVFAILHVEQPLRNPFSVTQVSKQELPLEKDRLPRSAPAPATVPSPPPTAPSFQAESRIPIELALILRGDSKKAISPSRSRMKSDVESLERNEQANGPGFSPPRALLGASRALPEERKAFSPPSLKAQAPKPEGDLSDAAGGVEEIIRSAGGKVKEIEHEKGAPRPTSILLDIPANRLPELLKGLDRLGALKNPPPISAEGFRGTLAVRLRMVYPEG